MRFKPESQHGGNAGLGVARQKLEGIRQKYPDLSYGDLWTLAGVCAIQQMVSFSPCTSLIADHGAHRYLGRSDNSLAPRQSGWSGSRLHARWTTARWRQRPWYFISFREQDHLSQRGLDHIRDIFYRMGWNDQEIVALSGAHALGRCHPDRSGFKGPWTPSPTLMTNDYFKRLLGEKYAQFTSFMSLIILILPSGGS